MVTIAILEYGYLSDDILVAGQAPEEYLLALEQVLSRLEKAGL